MINLGDKKWGVKDSGLLAYKQVGSRFFSKDFDFSRASDGTYVGKDGLLKTAELYNLLPYSQDFSQWDLISAGSADVPTITENYIQSPSGILNAYRLQMETNGSLSSDQSYIKDSVALDGSSNYVFSFYIKSNTGVDQDLISFINSSFDDQFTATNEWTRVEISFISNSTNNRNFGLMARGDIEQSIDVSIYGAQIVLGTEPLDYQYTNGLVGIPRISFEDGVGHLLLEPQRSNLLLQSNSFDTTWGNTNTSEASGYSGIYNSNDAWLLTKTISGFSHIFQNVSTSGTKTTSVYAKANTLGGLRLLNIGGGNADAYFDLINGTVTFQDPSTIEATIESVGNGWYRCSFTDAETITQTRIYPVQEDRSFDGTGSIYIQHAQLESGSYPTSIIETTTTSVTRLADVCNNSGSAQDFNSEEGVLYAEIAALSDDGTNRVIGISDGTTSNRVLIFFATFSNNFRYLVQSSGVVVADSYYTISSTLDFHKLAVRYKENDFSLWVDGVEVVTDISGTAPTGLNELAFDNGAGTLNFYGKVRSVKYFPEALTDEQLQNLTT